MAFWSDASIGVPEPKRAYRFLVYFGNTPQWLAKKVQKPTFEINQTEHAYLNHTFKYPGRVTWKDVTLTLTDPASPDSVQAVYNMLRNSGYVPPDSTGAQFDTRTISKAAAVASVGQVSIQQIGDRFPQTSDAGVPGGPGGVQTEILEEWILYNPWIKSYETTELSYEADELIEVTLTLAYDYAKLNGENSGGFLKTNRQTFNSIQNSLNPNT